MNPISCSTLLVKKDSSYTVDLFERYEDSVLIEHCKSIGVKVFDFFVVSIGTWGPSNAADLTESDVADILKANTCREENKDKPGFNYSRWAGDRVIMLDMDARTCGWWDTKTESWIYY